MKFARVLYLLFALLPAISCSDDTSTNSRVFVLTIDNQSTMAFDVFMSVSTGPPGFQYQGPGPVVPQFPKRIENLTVGPTYTFRVAPVGAGADAFVHEHVVTSTGGNMTWVFN